MLLEMLEHLGDIFVGKSKQLVFNCEEVCLVTGEEDFSLERLFLYFKGFVLRYYLSTLRFLLAPGNIRVHCEDRVVVSVRSAQVNG